jgi:protein-S-isoprenylcysteine O-methyltransferase Ste14
MGKHNTGLHEVLEGRVYRESPLVGVAAKLGSLSQHFGIPMLLIYLFGPVSPTGSRSAVSLYFTIAAPIACAALALRWWCYGYVREKEFIVNGPYRYVRNPVELSNILAYIAGAILLRFPWWYFGVVVGLSVVYMSFVSIAYERRLVELYGTQYLRYIQRVRRWIPSSLPATNPLRPDFFLTRAFFMTAGVWLWILGFLVIFGLRFRYGPPLIW